MPDGVVQWFDPESGRASIVRSGRVYTAVDTDLEPVARHPGAHVHFDVLRDGGAERAVDVKLRSGTRVSHRQGRYGSLAGARRPDTKGPAPFARAHPDRGRMLATHPLEVLRAWVDCLQAGDLDGALALCRSDAVLHAPGEDDVGPSQLGGYLGASPLFGLDRDPDVRGEDGTVVARWEVTPTSAVEVRARTDHGQITELWVGGAPPEGRTVELEAGAGAGPIGVVTHGRVDPDDVDYAMERIGALLDHIDDPILLVRLKLGRAGDPARERPALAQVVVDVNGELLRAQVAAHTMREAADLLQQHLRDKLDQRAQHLDALRTRSPERQPGEWRHGDLPEARRDFFDRPAGERELVRHKTFAVDELTPDEAAFDMAQLGYGFHLFRDLASGEDAVLEHRPEGGYRLTRLHAAPVAPGPEAIDLTVAEVEPPVLTVPEALERLDTGGEPFVFFAHAASGRGNVAYRRYDGHYGLITPA